MSKVFLHVIVKMNFFAVTEIRNVQQWMSMAISGASISSDKDIMTPWHTCPIDLLVTPLSLNWMKRLFPYQTLVQNFISTSCDLIHDSRNPKFWNLS
jgi:hypothetical protein